MIDGVVNGAGSLAGFTGGLLRYVQSGNVQRYAAFLFAGVVVLGTLKGIIVAVMPQLLRVGCRQ